MDSGNEKVSDSLEQQALRRQARKVYLEAFVAAAVLTGVAMVIPVAG